MILLIGNRQTGRQTGNPIIAGLYTVKFFTIAEWHNVTHRYHIMSIDYTISMQILYNYHAPAW